MEGIIVALHEIDETMAVTDARQPVTGYLRSWKDADRAAFERLIALVHVELHRVDLQDRGHSFAVAARAMRQILVDHARAKTALERGGRAQAMTFDSQLVASRPEELLALDDALTALEVVDERKATTIELRYFAGMERMEIATAMAVHAKTVARDLRIGEAWIHRHLLGER